MTGSSSANDDARGAEEAAKNPQFVGAASDARTVNNVVRHEYRVLTEGEKSQMLKIKDMGREFIAYLETLPATRENAIAMAKIVEAVMCAVKGIMA